MMPPGARPIPDAEAEMNRLAAERKIPPHVRKLLDESAAVVRPGETLIIRADPDWTPNQVREVQDWLDRWHSAEESPSRLPFRAIVLPGEEFAVAKAAAE